MQKFKVILLLMLVLLVLTPAVSAYNGSFADPDATTHRDVHVYCGSTLQGVYNTTSSNVPINCDALFVIKPQYSSPLDDPSAFLTAFIGWVQTNALVLILVSMVGALLFKRF